MIESICRVHYVWPSDEVKTAFGIGIIFVQFFIPFTVLVFCYGKIVWVLTRRINIDLITDKSKESNIGQLSEASVKVKAITKDEHKHKFQLARRNN